MLTIDVKTKAVTNKHEHDPVIVNTAFGRMDQTPGYIRGWLPPRYPVPALIMQVEWSYILGPELWVFDGKEWTTPINNWWNTVFSECEVLE